MQFTAVFTVLAAFAGAVSAVSIYERGNVCSTGSAQCCQTTTNDAHTIASLNSLLGPIDNVAGHIGAQCIPVGVLIGVPITNNCKANAVCCTGQSQNGLIQTGCTPINAA